MDKILGQISSHIDKKYIYNETIHLVNDKFYSEDLLDDCFKKFFQAEREYEDNYDSNKLVYKVRLKDETITVKFDRENIYHIFGLPNYRVLVDAVIIRKVLLDKYNIDISKDNADEILFKKIKYIDHLKVISDVFSKYDEEIKKFDCDELNIEEEKLNWDKILMKLFCFLNIGDLTRGDTSYYGKKVENGKNKELLFKRDLIIGDNVEYSLTIQFVEEVSIEPRSGFKKIFYSPKSIRIEKIPNKRVYTRIGSKNNNEMFVYCGEVTINKQNIKVKEVK